MAESYDLTEDNRGLHIGRLVDMNLVVIRNRAYVLTMQEHNRANEEGRVSTTHDSIELYELANELLNQ